MRITLGQLRQILREAMTDPIRMNADQVREYFPDALDELINDKGGDPDAEGAVYNGMKFYFKDGALYARSWDASQPTLKWSTAKRWEQATYN